MIEFIPNYAGKVKRDPLADDPHREFPFDEVFENLDGLAAHVEQFDTELGRGQIVRFVREFLATCFRGDSHGGVPPRGTPALQRIGLRCVVIGWLIDPAIFDGAPLSQSRLGEHLGLSSQCLSRETAKMSKLLGIRNRFQAHFNGRDHGKPVAIEQRDVERDVESETDGGEGYDESP